MLWTEVNQTVISKSHSWPGYMMYSRVLLLQECGGHISEAAPWRSIVASAGVGVYLWCGYLNLLPLNSYANILPKTYGSSSELGC